MRLLFIPDQLIGSKSGHRSADWFIKQAKNRVSLGVYAPGLETLGARYSGVEYISRTTVNLDRALREFNPDLVYFFGSSGFEHLATSCLENKVKYCFHFLTTIFYCPQNFASREGKPCYSCLGDLPIKSVLNNCDVGVPKAVKFPRQLYRYSKYRNAIKNCNIWIGHSKTQLNQVSYYNNTIESIESPIFFNSEDLKKVRTNRGNYVYFGGQTIDSKGWSYLKELISMTNCVFKTTFFDEESASKSIAKYDLSTEVREGRLIYETGLSEHIDFLRVTADASAVVNMSCYDTTGEFTLLEAMGLGKTVFCFDVGFHLDRLDHGIHVYKVSVGDILSLSNQLNEFLSLSESTTDLGVKAKNFVRSLTSSDSYDKYFNKLNNVVFDTSA